MSKFIEGIEFRTETCCNCGIPFAMTADFRNKMLRLREKGSFYCPAGHGQHFTGAKHFTGASEEDKLRSQLDEAKRQRDEANARKLATEHELERVSKAHKRMRVRIAAGVCPCCNRSFENLRRHMASEHADFGAPATFAALRKAFGMTQADVAREANTVSAYVSMYENGKRVPRMAEKRLDNWMHVNEAKSA